MTATPITFVRLSPSGKFLGAPPLRLGPGSEGIIARKSGASTTQLLPAIDASIAGLGTVPVAMEKGYLYELDLITEVITTDLTATGGYYVLYRVRDKTSQTWTTWTGMTGQIHALPLTPTRNDSDVQFRDVMPGLGVFASADAVEFGVHGDADNATHAVLYGQGCYACVREYMP
jgi:hypothetical protein